MLNEGNFILRCLQTNAAEPLSVFTAQNLCCADVNEGEHELSAESYYQTTSGVPYFLEVNNTF